MQADEANGHCQRGLTLLVFLIIVPEWCKCIPGHYSSAVIWRNAMKTRQIVIDVPEKILLAEKTDESTFARELRVLAAIKV